MLGSARMQRQRAVHPPWPDRLGRYDCAHVKARNAFEMAGVMGDQRERVVHGGGGDPSILRVDGVPSRLALRAQLAPDSAQIKVGRNNQVVAIACSSRSKRGWPHLRALAHWNSSAAVINEIVRRLPCSSGAYAAARVSRLKTNETMLVSSSTMLIGLARGRRGAGRRHTR